jgi:hypothetical protein
MKACWIFGIAMAAGISAHAQDCVVTVYVSTDLLPPAGMLFRAEEKATAIFRDADVRLRWHRGAPPAIAPGDACGAPLVVRIQGSERVHASAEALAFAAPFADSGTCIHVLLDRVLRDNTESLAPVVLAYVLAHEITHVLERINRHSKDGIMKAHWDCTDYRRMAFEGLRFAPEDLELIHRGIAQRMLRAAAE